MDIKEIMHKIENYINLEIVFFKYENEIYFHFSCENLYKGKKLHSLNELIKNGGELYNVKLKKFNNKDFVLLPKEKIVIAEYYIYSLDSKKNNSI